MASYNVTTGTVLLQCGHGLSAVENGQVGGLRARAGGASMRPRPVGRGERPSNLDSQPLYHCFNAATASRPWRTRAFPVPGRSAKRLQCGHGLSAVENGDVLDVRQERLGASMRPRPLGRGEPRRIHRVRPRTRSFNAATASRPWRTLIFDELHAQPNRLQCGHGLSAVENLENIEQAGRRIVLQCGHGLSAVENGREVAMLIPMLLGFNAATASRPWRTPARCPPRRRPGSFNAATASRPWRTTTAPCRMSVSAGCFNAATASRPWRTRVLRRLS